MAGSMVGLDRLVFAEFFALVFADMNFSYLYSKAQIPGAKN